MKEGNVLYRYKIFVLYLVKLSDSRDRMTQAPRVSMHHVNKLIFLYPGAANIIP